MDDYKADQDRWFDELRDQRELATSVERQQREAARAQRVKIDRVAKRLIRVGVYETMAEARAVLIRAWKKNGRLPADFPESDGAGLGNALD